MARTTPAQNPRGEHKRTFSSGFSGEIGIRILKNAPFWRKTFRPDMGWPTLPCQARGCMQGGLTLYSGHFPIITDDLVLRPASGRSA